jgi:hypothetical protein
MLVAPMNINNHSVEPFTTTFDDLFNEAFNSYQPEPSEFTEIEVNLISIVDDALNRFKKYCLSKDIFLECKVIGENSVMLKVKRNNF